MTSPAIDILLPPASLKVRRAAQARQQQYLEAALAEASNWTLNWALLSQSERSEILDLCEAARDLLMLPVTPNIKQLRVILSTERGIAHPILFGGAMGGGKSALLCMLAIRMARLVKRNRILLARTTHAALEISTKAELLEQLTHCPDAVHQPGYSRVHFPKTGSYIYYLGAGRPHEINRMLSVQWGMIGCDEVPDFTRETYDKLSTRLRWGPAAAADQLWNIATANPTPGWVKDDWVSPGRPGYRFIQSLPFDNPYLNGGDYLGYIHDMRARMPDDWVKAYVEGDWDALLPSSAAIPRSLLLAALSREEQPNDRDRVWGLDVSRKGDDWTVLYQRDGYQFRLIERWRHKRTTQTIDRLMYHFSQAWPKPRRINIDDNGVGGGVSDMLVRESYEYNMGDTVIGECIAQSRADDPLHYYNKRAELFGIFRGILEARRGDIDPEDPLVIDDLATPLAAPTSGGKLAVEPKIEVQKRLGRSPDNGDALLLTMYEGKQVDYVPHETEQERMERELSEIEDEDERQIRLQALEQQRRLASGMTNLLKHVGVRPVTSDPDDLDLGY